MPRIFRDEALGYGVANHKAQGACLNGLERRAVAPDPAQAHAAKAGQPYLHLMLWPETRKALQVPGRMERILIEIPADDLSALSCLMECKLASIAGAGHPVMCLPGSRVFSVHILEHRPGAGRLLIPHKLERNLERVRAETQRHACRGLSHLLVEPWMPCHAAAERAHARLAHAPGTGEARCLLFRAERSMEEARCRRLDEEPARIL